MPDDPRRDAVAAILKVVGVAVGIGVAIGVVVLVMVRVLGVGSDAGSASRPVDRPDAPLSSLPTTALTPSGSPSEDPTTETAAPEATPSKQAGIQLSAAPTDVQPSQRINLTGTYAGQDNLQLQVQRKENGTWSPFANVRATVKVGSFGTWVVTSRTGKSVFRVYDPTTSTASNPVTVTVG